MEQASRLGQRLQRCRRIDVTGSACFQIEYRPARTAWVTPMKRPSTAVAIEAVGEMGMPRPADDIALCPSRSAQSSSSIGPQPLAVKLRV